MNEIEIDKILEILENYSVPTNGRLICEACLED
jgi:hypothetical protein